MSAQTIEKRLEDLRSEKYYLSDPRVKELIAKIQQEHSSEIADLEAQLKKNLSQRWSPTTPKAVVDLCKWFWHEEKGEDEFRIHCWGEDAIWTSVPPQVEWLCGAEVMGLFRYVMISRLYVERDCFALKPKVLKAVGSAQPLTMEKMKVY